MTTAFRRRYPIRADRVNYVASNALALAFHGNPKLLASEACISERRARDWLNGDPGSPFAKVFEIIAGVGQSAAVIVAAARTILTQTLMRMSGSNLEREFFSAMDAETEAEGRTNIRQMRQPRTLDELRELQLLAIEEAAQLERLAALCGELIEQKIVPQRDT